MNPAWVLRRLLAMSPAEVGYRLSQKKLQSSERKRFANKIPVYEVTTYGQPSFINLSCLGLNFNNDNYTVGFAIELLGSYSYDDYKCRWHAAFQSEGDWPLKFSPDYSFSADDVPGDIRTNWELNRHYQFTVLSKSYFVTGNEEYLKELADLFEDWDARNPFLWGSEWASPMELAIRLVNWLISAAFLEHSTPCEAQERIRNSMISGAWVMAAYVREHYSRYSSANNHTIVEAMGVGIAAVVFGQESWLQEAETLLSKEVVNQTYSDGVNKEQALHYQLFVMEAFCLLLHAYRAAGKAAPVLWLKQLDAMAGYVRACCAGSGAYITFGDDDEGVIVNLACDKPNYPEYVLSLSTMELESPQKWTEDLLNCESVHWLYGVGELDEANARDLKQVNRCAHFPEGGMTILRNEHGVVLAMDHGPLGFGSLAAHGHADALSVQMYINGESILVDSGTYIYNGNSEMRNVFRSTTAHNTVCIDGKDQSEILGAFLWGRKARAKLLSIDKSNMRLSASHDGYAPITHERAVAFNDEEIIIVDSLSGGTFGAAGTNFHFPNCEVEKKGNSSVELRFRSGSSLRLESDASLKTETFQWSSRYGELEPGVCVSVDVIASTATRILLPKEKI